MNNEKSLFHDCQLSSRMVDIPLTSETGKHNYNLDMKDRRIFLSVMNDLGCTKKVLQIVKLKLHLPKNPPGETGWGIWIYLRVASGKIIVPTALSKRSVKGSRAIKSCEN